ncbi:MAG: Coenzyme F420 hydrogenase/dehydrogenase, beta subunit C-terminal domain [Archaeoglobaceae archaeon]
MIEEIRNSLKGVEVDAVIGFKRKENEPREVLHVFKPDEIEQLTFSPMSAHNTARMLIEALKRYNRVAVVAKGCDAETIRQLIKEQKVDRERVYIVGVSCSGVVDYRKFRRAVNFRLSDVKEVVLEGDELVVKASGGEQRIPFSEVMARSCAFCRSPTPTLYDVLVGEPREGRLNFADVEELEKLDREQRWNYWIEVFGRCIRCHACRQVCPICYCEECIVDPTNLAISPMTPPEEKAAYPRVLGKTVSARDNMIYHILRVLHHAGRCTGCGECERACPMELPLTTLERKLWKVVSEEFGYSPDEDVPFLSKLDVR